MKKFIKLFLFLLVFCGCSQSIFEDKFTINLDKENLSIGESLLISYNTEKQYDFVEVSLNKDNNNFSFGKQKFNKQYSIRRLRLENYNLNYDKHKLNILFYKDNLVETKNIDIEIEPSIVINNFFSLKILLKKLKKFYGKDRKKVKKTLPTLWSGHGGHKFLHKKVATYENWTF